MAATFAYCVTLALAATALAAPHKTSPQSTAATTAAASTCPANNYGPVFSRKTSFTFPVSVTTQYATPVAKATPAPTYADAYSAVASLFSNQSTTSWPNWTPLGLAIPTFGADQYNTAAWSQLWNDANPASFTRGLYSTTASPTAIPSSALIKPPPLYFQPPANCYKFPKNFIFGTACSAGQVEGAVADQGKSPNFLDVLANVLNIAGKNAIGGGVLGTPEGQIVSNAVSAEGYYLYQRDIDRLAAAGLKHFSFSLSWSRILPFTFPGTPVNSYAIQHYNDVIDYVLSKGMIPIVTLAHFDTPLALYGGGKGYLATVAKAASNSSYGLGGVSFAYTSSRLEEAYVNYAKIALAHFADRVPIWITFNEPQIGSENATAVTNVLRSHARVYRYYRDVLKGKGKISIKMGITPAVPLDATNPSSVEAAKFFSDLYTFPYLYPTVFGQQYPDNFLKALPGAKPLTSEELKLINGTMDFISLDAYSAPLVYNAGQDLDACARDHTANRPFPICVNGTKILTTGWDAGWNPIGKPTGYLLPGPLRTQLNLVWSKFGKPILISEFGLSPPPPPGGELSDNLYNVPQTEYLLSYLNEMLKAIWEDGVDVMGALVWTFVDDWEFGFFNTGFGLQYLNHTTQERVYRRSIFDVVDFVEGKRQK